jgi:RNA polymerase sigma-70 factor (ECF subfamily)
MGGGPRLKKVIMNLRMMEPTREGAWTQALAQGDPAAFEVLVRETRPALGSFLRRLCPSPHDAEDLVQETYLRVYQHRQRFDARSSVKTWMYSIALNLFRDKARRKGPGPLQAAPGVAEQVPVERRLEKAELAERVERLVQSLPEGQREIFTLYRYEGIPYDDIARMLGITVGAARAQMHHALQKIRSGLEPLGYGS